MEYAAHISYDGKIQTVDEHCLNTAKLCEKYTESIGGAEIGYLQGIFHDVGKNTKRFNDYIRGTLNIPRGSIDHCYAGAKYLMENFSENYQEVLKLISRTIISHHGLHDWINEECVDYFSKRITEKEEYDNVKRILDNFCIGEHLEKAFTEYNNIVGLIKNISKNNNVEQAFYMGMLERFLQSCLIDADRTDTASFQLGIEINDCENVSKLWNEMHYRMENKMASFKDRTDSISLQRQSISERCAKFAENNVKVCRLIVPTGGGKTLSSLRFAIDYCKIHEMERIIYTAPFMSILEQNSDEIRAIAGDDYFIEHHSNFISEMSSTKEELMEYEIHMERWDSPVIATTFVQFLNTLFSHKLSCVRRMHRLSKSVIIIDEIQSLPTKCVYMFNLAINFLTHICGATVVLSSATQPVNEKIKYPIIIDNNQSMTGDYIEDFKVFERTEITFNIDPYGFTFDDTAKFCFEKFSEFGNLLVIVNTKASAKNIYELLKKKCSTDTKVIHLSTNMCPEHRKEKLDIIRNLLAKKQKVICVTTQLIEAGVDISFKCVVRSLAGLDSIVQAAGRCNRHGEYDIKCPVYIVKIKEENLSNLDEIAKAQDTIESMLEYSEYDNWQSNEAVSEYFQSFYEIVKSSLSYSVKNDTILNFLSLNKKRYNAYRINSNMPMDIYSIQAFKTAGELFQVIDKDSIDIIVPYNDEAKEIINELENVDKKDMKKILRKAQKYSVSIYKGSEIKLSENNALRTLDCGVTVLNDIFYNLETGITFEGADIEPYIF